LAHSLATGPINLATRYTPFERKASRAWTPKALTVLMRSVTIKNQARRESL